MGSMLTGIRLHNFKCFEELTLENLGRINVFIGPNGSGKSSVLQALMALKQSMSIDVLKLRGEYVDLVGGRETVFRGDMGRRIAIGFTARASAEHVAADCAYDAEFQPRDADTSRLTRNALSITWEGEPIAIGWRSEGDNVASPDIQIGALPVATKGNPKVGNPLTVEPKGGIPPGNDRAYTIIHFLNAMCGNEIASWRFSTIVRGFVGSSFELGEERLSEIPPRMGIEDAAAGIATTMVYDPDHIAGVVSRWIACVTDVEVNARAREQRRAVLSSVRDGLPIPITSEGFGTNQLAFLLFAIALAPSGCMLAIEEPETHLHPLAISRLGDLLVRVARERDLQLLLTTHSEYLLLNLLNNVAEGALDADELAVFYFERDGDRCVARRVGINERGMVEGGLPGFFDASLEAQRRHMAALAHVA